MGELCERIIEVRDILWSRRKLIIGGALIGVMVGLLLSATSSPKTIVMVEIDPPQSGASDIRGELSAMGLHAVQWPNGQISVDLSYTPEDRQVAIDRRSVVEAYIKTANLKSRTIERPLTEQRTIFPLVWTTLMGFLMASSYAVGVATFSRKD